MESTGAELDVSDIYQTDKKVSYPFKQMEYKYANLAESLCLDKEIPSDWSAEVTLKLEDGSSDLSNKNLVK